MDRPHLSWFLFGAALLILGQSVPAQPLPKNSVPTMKEVSKELHNVKLESATAAAKIKYWSQQIETYQKQLQNSKTKGGADQTTVAALEKAQQQWYEWEQKRDALHRYELRLIEYRAKVQMDGAGAGPPPWTKSRPPMPYPVGAGFSKSPGHREASLARIEGDWLLPSGGPGQDIVITVTHDPKNDTYAGTLITKGNIRFYSVGDTIFKVRPSPGSPGSFSGTEYGYDSQGHRQNSPLSIVVKGQEMTYTTGADRQRFIRP